MDGNLDARAKLIAAFGAILIVSSTPPGQLWPFSAYFILIFCGSATASFAQAPGWSRGQQNLAITF